MSDRRCVTGPPHCFHDRHLEALAYRVARAHLGTETSIDAPEVLAAGSVVACIWPLPNVLPCQTFSVGQGAKMG